MAEAGRARRVFPPPGAEVPEIHGDVEFPGAHPSDPRLPYVAINMVSSVDGRVSSGGKSGSIGGAADRGAMRALRSKVDAVAAGAGTLRAEKLSLTSGGRRTPEPKAVLAATTLDLPMGNLADATKEDTIVMVPEGARGAEDNSKLREVEGRATVMRAASGPDGRIDFTKALIALKESHGINALLLEGGPAINHEFVSMGLVSEIFLTIAPKLLGGGRGGAPGILDGPRTPGLRNISLRSIHVSDPGGEVFLRYELASGGG